MTQGYSAEEHAAAWAAYYAQQGYDPHTIAAMTASSSQPQPQVQAQAGPSQGSGSGSGYTAAPAHARIPAGTQLLDQDLLAQSSVYLPGATEKLVKEGKYKPPPGKRQTVVRKGGGKTWEDTSLLDWDPKWFRLFVGDVSNDVNERTLDAAFNKYPSFCKCKVVRDRLSEKAKYGFIAFTDPEDFLKAWKEMDGKYVGNRPIKLSKIKDDVYGKIDTVSVSGRKAKELDKLRKNRGKPLDGRPVPF